MKYTLLLKNLKESSQVPCSIKEKQKRDNLLIGRERKIKSKFLDPYLQKETFIFQKSYPECKYHMQAQMTQEQISYI